MANTLLLKSNQSAGAPNPGSDILVAEIALDTYSGEMYMGKKQGGDPGDDSTHVASPLMKHGGTMTGGLVGTTGQFSSTLRCSHSVSLYHSDTTLAGYIGNGSDLIPVAIDGVTPGSNDLSLRSVDNFGVSVSNSTTPAMIIKANKDTTHTVNTLFRVSGTTGVKLDLNAAGTNYSWLEYEKDGVDQWLVGTESSETDFQWYFSPTSAGTKMRLTGAGKLTTNDSIVAGGGGSASTPNFAFAEDPDCGIYYNIADNQKFAIAVEGSRIMYATDSGATSWSGNITCPSLNLGGIQINSGSLVYGSIWQLRGASSGEVRLGSYEGDLTIETSTSNDVEYDLNLKASNVGQIVNHHTAHFQDGALALPGIAFENDTDTGIYRTGGNGMALVTGGTAAIGISSAQAVVHYGETLLLGAITTATTATFSGTVQCATPTADAHAATKAYVDTHNKCWSSATYGTRAGVAETWYIGKSAMGTSSVPTSAEFDSNLLKQQDVDFFIAPHVVTVKAIGFVGAVSYANNWEVQFWKVNFDDLDTSTDAETQIGSTIAFTGSTSAMYNKLETGLDVALAVGDCIFTSVRFKTGGSTNKYLYANTVIQYETI